nr:MAG TPA: HOLLIDAY JUNCTION RESOLVASE [Caudoviricetes sp.]
MSRICPLNHSIVLYMDCLDCDDKICKQSNKSPQNVKYDPKEVYHKMHTIIVGIDQSYKDTGISIWFDGKLKQATDCFAQNLENNTVKRSALRSKLLNIFGKLNAKKLAYNSVKEDCELICIIERIRLQSQGFINIDYIKSIGALNAMIVDTANIYNIQVYSVDTRAWKSAVVGTSKGKANKYGFDEKKWPTILWCIKQGYKSKIKADAGRKKKGVIEKNGKRYTYNDNIADSIGIGKFYFVGDISLLKEEH